MIDPDKWAEQIESQLREEEKIESRMGQVFVEKRRFLDSHAALLWKQLANSLGELARAFNKRRNILTIEDEGESLRVRRSDDAGAALLSATFDHLENSIALLIRPGGWFRHYATKVIPSEGQGVVCLVWQDPETGNKSQYPIEEIATAAMEELLKSDPMFAR